MTAALSADPQQPDDDDVFDLDAASAAADEADERPFSFRYHGTRYRVPSPKRWPLSAQRDLENGLLEETMPKLIGSEAYEAMIADGATFGDLELIFEAIARKASLPNSRRSGPPSRRAGTRTRRR